MSMDGFDLSFSGQIDLVSIMNSLKYMLPDEAVGEIHIAFSRQHTPMAGVNYDKKTV